MRQWGHNSGAPGRVVLISDPHDEIVELQTEIRTGPRGGGYGGTRRNAAGYRASSSMLGQKNRDMSRRGSARGNISEIGNNGVLTTERLKYRSTAPLDSPPRGNGPQRSGRPIRVAATGRTMGRCHGHLHGHLVGGPDGHRVSTAAARYVVVAIRVVDQ